MGLVTVSARPLPPFAPLPTVAASIRAGCSLSSPSPSRRRCRQVLPRRRLRPLGISVSRFGNFTSKCSVTNADVDLDHLATVDEIPQEHPSLQPDWSLPFVHLTSDVLDSKSLNLFKEESYINSIFTELPVLSEEEQDALAATPAHPAGLYAGNLVEQLWNFAWPAAVAALHPSLLPVAVLGFFGKGGASIFGILLTKYDTVTCLKLASGLMMCTLPVLIVLGQLINRLSSGVLGRCKVPQNSEPSFGVGPLPSVGKLVKHGMDAIRHGWVEYKHQPLLPASVAYALLYFNIALALGAIMTAFLMHHGTSPSIIGGFSGACAFMGVVATFISATLVKKLGILKAGAAGLIFQALLLAMAVAVVCSSSISQRTPLLLFLSLIVLSRLGHMSYDVVGTRILQTGIPLSKANFMGATEVSIACLAEFLMLGVAIIANDVTHFGFLAMLSMSSVVGAAWIFCQWLANPTTEQRKLFSFNPQFA